MVWELVCPMKQSRLLRHLRRLGYHLKKERRIAVPSCSKGARSWSSGSPATVMLASFCSAAAPKAEIADARVRVILEESTEESWRWIHRSEPSTNASKAWTVEHLDGRLGSLPQWSTRARDVMTPVAGGCSPSRACRPPTGATSPQLLPLVGTPDAALNPSVT